jgi:hypothetical protein
MAIVSPLSDCLERYGRNLNEMGEESQEAGKQRQEKPHPIRGKRKSSSFWAEAFSLGILRKSTSYKVILIFFMGFNWRNW